MSNVVDKQALFTVMVAKLILYAASLGYQLTFGEAWRSDAQQEIYLKKGLSKSARSNHQDRLAVDFNLFVNGVFIKDGNEHTRKLGEFWESLGGRWGGRFGVQPIDWSTKIGWDANHFELP